MNRREFLAAGGTALATGLAGSACSYRPSERLMYRSGDTIATPYGSAKIHEWKIDFDPRDFDRYAKLHKDRNLRFELASPDINEKCLIDVGPYGGRTLLFIEDIDFKHVNWRMRGLPKKDGHATLDVEEEAEDGTFLFHRHYPIAFAYHTYEPDSDNIANMLSRSDIYAEVPIDQKDLKRLSDLSKDFHGFLLLQPPVYIYFRPDTPLDIKIEGDESNRGASANPQGYVSISAKNFLKPQVARQGEMEMFHEMSHQIVGGMRKHDMIRQMAALNQAFLSMAGAGWSNPHFKLFRESEYVKETPRFGHPSSNHDELFASGLTIFRYFPGEFIEKSRSDPQGRKAARTMLRVLHEMDYLGNNRRILLPAYDELVAAVSR